MWILRRRRDSDGRPEPSGPSAGGRRLCRRHGGDGGDQRGGRHVPGLRSSRRRGGDVGLRLLRRGRVRRRGHRPAPGGGVGRLPPGHRRSHPGPRLPVRTRRSASPSVAGGPADPHDRRPRGRRRRQVGTRNVADRSLPVAAVVDGASELGRGRGPGGGFHVGRGGGDARRTRCLDHGGVGRARPRVAMAPSLGRRRGHPGVGRRPRDRGMVARRRDGPRLHRPGRPVLHDRHRSGDHWLADIPFLLLAESDPRRGRAVARERRRGPRRGRR